MSKNEKVSDPHGYTRLFLGAIRIAGIALAVTLLSIAIAIATY